MWVVKQIVEWLIGKVFSAYYKLFGYAGILLLVLVAECIGLMIYRSEVLGSVDIHSNTIIADVLLKPEQNDPDVYEYEVLLENHESMADSIHSVQVKDQEGDWIYGEVIGVYQGAEDWAGVGAEDAIYVPAGSQVKVTVALDKSDLEIEKVEKLTFKIGYSGEEFSFEKEFPVEKE
ncbi:MAG: hypothetical protein HDR01_02655 [Lachnospiraceae bacterium]|nr:hypothetical protein [Lachnospiraceae bacterium]